MKIFVFRILFVSFVIADYKVTAPWPGKTIPLESTVTLHWKDDGLAPLFPDIISSSLALYSGDESNPIELLRLSSIDPFKMTISFDLPAEIKGGSGFFFGFTSVTLTDTSVTYTHQFILEHSNKVFNPETNKFQSWALKSALSPWKRAVVGPPARTTMQSIPPDKIATAPTPSTPGSTITAKQGGQEPLFPTSSVTSIYISYGAAPKFLTTFTPSVAYRYGSLPNDAAPQDMPTGGRNEL